MKTLDHALQRASEVLTSVGVTAPPFIVYDLGLRWQVKANVVKWALRGFPHLTVSGRGLTLSEAVRNFADVCGRKAAEEQTRLAQKRLTKKAGAR